MEQPHTDADLGDLSKHGMNCGWYGSYGDAGCTCSLKWRVALSTERTMHSAWRKRAEEAEAALRSSAVGAGAREALQDAHAFISTSLVSDINPAISKKAIMQQIEAALRSNTLGGVSND